MLPAVVVSDTLVLILDVINELIVPEFTLAMPIFAFDATLILVKTPLMAEMLLAAVMLLACRLPVTDTEPKVVAPPLAVEVNANHAAELEVPSAGHT